MIILGVIQRVFSSNVEIDRYGNMLQKGGTAIETEDCIGICRGNHYNCCLADVKPCTGEFCC